MGLVEKRHQETQCLLPEQKYSYYVRNGFFHTVGSSCWLVKRTQIYFIYKIKLFTGFYNIG